MNNKHKLFLIIVVIILSFIIIKKNNVKTNVENAEGVKNVENYSGDLFKDIKEAKQNNYWDQLGHRNKSVDCYKLNPRNCMKYANCGLCVKNGNMECVPGDVQGPFFKDDCRAWVHTNYYDRHIFKEKVVTVSPPWSMFYPDYEAWWPSPTSRVATSS